MNDEICTEMYVFVIVVWKAKLARYNPKMGD